MLTLSKPDTETPSGDLVGVNIPEYFDALRSAASLAHGYYWGPVAIWQNKKNRRNFFICRKGTEPNKNDWLKVTTVHPHARKSR
jgi:hypothetical protein